MSGERYRIGQDLSSIKYDIVSISEVFSTSSGGTPLKEHKKYYQNGTIPWLRSGEVAQGFINSAEIYITEDALKNSCAKIFPVNTVLVAMYGATAGQVGILKFEAATNQAICGILPNGKAIPEYTYLILKSQKDYLISLISGGGAQPNISQKIIRELKIPLPPLPIQQQIVSEIESYQKIIDGAKMVVENYKPKIDIDEGWEMVELGEVCEHITKGTTPTTNGFKWQESGINFIKIENINTDGTISPEKLSHISEACHENLKRSQLQVNNILFSIAGTKMGIVGMVDSSLTPANTNQALAIIRTKGDFESSFLKHYLMSANVQDEMEKIKVGVAQSNLSLKQVSEIKVPRITLHKQIQIVSQIEKEQELVNSAKQLIKLFEQKIKDRIAKVWGE